jgi:hypothetical protein
MSKVLLNILTLISFKLKLDNISFKVLVKLIENMEIIYNHLKSINSDTSSTKSTQDSRSHIFVKCDESKKSSETTNDTTISDIHSDSTQVSSEEKETEQDSGESTICSNKVDIKKEECCDEKEKTETEEKTSICKCDKCIRSRVQKRSESSIKRIKKIFADIGRSFYVIKSILKHYNDNSLRFINKFGMYDPAKNVNQFDILYYNTLVDNLYDKMKTNLQCIKLNIKSGLSGIIVKVGLKTLRFCELFDMTIEQITDDSGKYLKIKAENITFSVYYLGEGMTNEIMFNTIEANMLLIPELIKIINANILMASNDLTVIESIKEIECKSLQEIVEEIEIDLDEE